MACNFIGYSSAPRSQQYAIYINRYHEQYPNIPSEVVAGLIKTENSSWNPALYSSDKVAQDFGLGQFTLSTRTNYGYTNYTANNPAGQIKDIYDFLTIKQKEMNTKTIWETVRRYNGSGPASYVYMNKVKSNTSWILKNACGTVSTSEPSVYEVEKAEETRIALAMAQIKKQESIDQALAVKERAIAYATHDENAIQKAEQVIESRLAKTEKAKADLLKTQKANKKKATEKAKAKAKAKAPTTPTTDKAKTVIAGGITITVLAILIYIYNGYIPETTSGLEGL